MQGFCPNCQTRMADTPVHYDELAASRYSRTSMGYGGSRRSFSSISTSGDDLLCAQCAANYLRMVRLRTLGATIGNRGFIALAVTVVLFIFVYGAVPATHQGAGLSIALVPILLAALAVLLGGVLALASRAMRPSATRFLRERPSTSDA